MANSVRWIQAKTGDATVQYTAQQDRLFFASMWPTEGVLGTGHLKVTQRAAGANMSVDVAAGSAVVNCDTVSNGGAYHYNESAISNVAIPAAPGSGSRTHLICAQVRDPQSDGGTNYTSQVICVADTGSGATQPPSAYTLATVTVVAGTASITNAVITDVRVQAVPRQAFTRSNGPVTMQLTTAGRTTIAHGLGVVPSSIQITSAGAGNAGVEIYTPNVFWNSSTPDATNFIVEWIKPDGTTGQGGQTVVFTWHADA